VRAARRPLRGQQCAQREARRRRAARRQAFAARRNARVRPYHQQICFVLASRRRREVLRAGGYSRSPHAAAPLAPQRRREKWHSAGRRMDNSRGAAGSERREALSPASLHSDVHARLQNCLRRSVTPAARMPPRNPAYRQRPCRALFYVVAVACSPSACFPHNAVRTCRPRPYPKTKNTQRDRQVAVQRPR